MFELLRIVEKFATGFDDRPELVAGRVDFRVLIASGTLISGFSGIGQLAQDGTSDLVQLDLGLGNDW